MHRHMTRSRRKRARLPANGAESSGDDETHGAEVAAPAVDDADDPGSPVPAEVTAPEQTAPESELPTDPGLASHPNTPASAAGQGTSRPGDRRGGATNFTTELRVRVLASVLRFVGEKMRLPQAQDLAAILDPVRATASPAVGRIPERFDQVKNIIRGVEALESKVLGAFEQVDANPTASKRFHILAAYHHVLCVLGPALSIAMESLHSSEPVDSEYVAEELERVDIDAAVLREAHVRAGGPGATPLAPAASSSPFVAAEVSSAARGAATVRTTVRSTARTAHPSRTTYAGEAIAGRQVFSSAVPAMTNYSARMEDLAGLQRAVAQGVMFSNMISTWFASALADPRRVSAFAQDTPVPTAGSVLLAEESSVGFARSMSEFLRAIAHGGAQSSGNAAPGAAAAPRTSPNAEQGAEAVAGATGSAPDTAVAADTGSSVLHLASSPAPLRALVSPATRRGQDGQSRTPSSSLPLMSLTNSWNSARGKPVIVNTLSHSGVQCSMTYI